MSKYNVRPIVIDNLIDSVLTWGVFDDTVVDPEKRHCKEEYPNLIVECYSRLNAEKIAAILNEDEKGNQ